MDKEPTNRKRQVLSDTENFNNVSKRNKKTENITTKIQESRNENEFVEAELKKKSHLTENVDNKTTQKSKNSDSKIKKLYENYFSYYRAEIFKGKKNNATKSWNKLSAMKQNIIKLKYDFTCLDCLQNLKTKKKSVARKRMLIYIERCVWNEVMEYINDTDDEEE